MLKNKETIIVIADDDDGHAELIKEALEDAGICNKMIRFPNGDETWNFFNNKDSENAISQDKNYLLLLDINMPILDGIEVLRRMKANKELKEIPIIMLTTTDDPKEIEECYKIGCNFYITKPVDFVKFAETLRRLGLFIEIVSI